MKKVVNFTNNHLFQNNNFYLRKSLRNNFLISSSGGQDSILSFFILFHSLKNFRLDSLYCNHFWQTKNFISSKVLFKLNYLCQIPYSSSLPQKLILSENESRRWRKKIYYRLSKLNQNSILVIGHTETDNLEKNFTNLLRGTSLNGVSENNFLYSKKIIESFFPQTNIQNYFFINLLKPTAKVSRKFFLEKNNFENYSKKKRKNFAPKSTISTIFERTEFQYFNPRKNYTKSIAKPFLLKRKSFSNVDFFTIKVRKHKNFFVRIFFLNSFNFFTGKTLFTRTLLIKNLSKSEIFSKNLDDPKNMFLGKEKTFKQDKSYSYCFSNQFLCLNPLVTKPLKKIRRSSISTIVKLYKLPMINDLTNFSSKFSRNKIRHQFIPFTRFLINQNSEFLLTNFFTLLTIENELKNQITKKLHFTWKNWALRSKEKSLTHSKLKKLFQKKKQNNNVINKLFLEYKNINLTYSQNQKLNCFLVKD